MKFGDDENDGDNDNIDDEEDVNINEDAEDGVDGNIEKFYGDRENMVMMVIKEMNMLKVDDDEDW